MLRVTWICLLSALSLGDAPHDFDDKKECRLITRIAQLSSHEFFDSHLKAKKAPGRASWSFDFLTHKPNCL